MGLALAKNTSNALCGRFPSPLRTRIADESMSEQPTSLKATRFSYDENALNEWQNTYHVG